MSTKKLFLTIVTITLCLMAFIYKSQKYPINSTAKKNHEISLQQQTSTTRPIITKQKKAPLRQSHKNFDINKLHPCQAQTYLAAHNSPWLYLKNDTFYSSFMKTKLAVKNFLNFKNITAQSRDKLEAQLNKLTYVSYIPLLKELHDMMKGSDKLNLIKRKLMDRISAEIDSQESLEASLVKAQIYYEQNDLSQAKRVLKEISQTKELSNFKSITRLREALLKSASTPSETAAAIDVLSRLPSFNTLFLLELKNKDSSVKFNAVLDNIALRIIKNTLNSKDPLSIDYLAYTVALKIHSKGKLFEQRYGNREELIAKMIREKTYDNSDTCDDRKLIELCNEYCTP